MRLGANPDELEEDGRETDAQIRRAIANLLRDIFGNPFHRVTFDPAWRKPHIDATAHTIYEEHRFAELPVFADALEQAGCTEKDILDHCRQDGEHERGCWVLDLILRKK